MSDEDYEIPPERERQFDLIAIGSERMLKWAREHKIALQHIEPVVPFVETDFSLDAWLFLDTEDRVKQYDADGTAERLTMQFRIELGESGYPIEWLDMVACHFGSKEVVDREYQGQYFLFLR